MGVRRLETTFRRGLQCIFYIRQYVECELHSVGYFTTQYLVESLHYSAAHALNAQISEQFNLKFCNMLGTRSRMI